MKFASTFLASLTCLAAAVSAQTVAIGLPADGAQITAGQPTVVQISQHSFLSSAEEIALVIGINSCTSSPCLPPTETLGTILYSGGFKPESHEHEPNKPAYYQNFTVNIPSDIAKGKAQINVLHFSLLGVSHVAFLEGKNVTVEIQ